MRIATGKSMVSENHSVVTPTVFVNTVPLTTRSLQRIRTHAFSVEIVSASLALKESKKSAFDAFPICGVEITES